MRRKIIAEISRWVEEEYRLGSTVGQKWRGTRRYCKPRNFLFQFAINKSTTPSLTGVPPVTALSKVRRRRKKTRKGRATGEGERRERWVQLGRIKGIKGRLVIRICRFPTSTPIRGKRRDEGEKKGCWKVCSFPAAI